MNSIKVSQKYIDKKLIQRSDNLACINNRGVLSTYSRKKILNYHISHCAWLFVSVLLLVSVRVASINQSYEVENLRVQAVRNQHELHQLQSEYALLTSPGVLVDKAKNKLAMIEISRKKVRKL